MKYNYFSQTSHLIYREKFSFWYLSTTCNLFPSPRYFFSIYFMFQKSITVWTFHNAQVADNIGQDLAVRHVRLGGRDLTVTCVTLTLDLPEYAIVQRAGQEQTAIFVTVGGWGLTVIHVKSTFGPQVNVILVTLAGLGQTVAFVTMAGQTFLVTPVTQILDLQDFATLVLRGGLGLTVVHVTHILNHQEYVAHV